MSVNEPTVYRSRSHVVVIRRSTNREGATDLRRATGRRAGPADPAPRARRGRHPDEGDRHLRERPAPVPSPHEVAPRPGASSPATSRAASSPRSARASSGWKVGDRVVPYFRRTCGQCAQLPDAAAPRLHQPAGPRTGTRAATARTPSTCASRQPCLMPLPGAPLVPGRRDPRLPGRHGVRAAGADGRQRARRPGRLGTGAGRAALGAVREGDGRHHRRDRSVGGPAGLAEKLGAALTIDPTAGPVGEQLRAHFPDGADKLTETSARTRRTRVMGDLLQAARHGRRSSAAARPELLMPLRT